MAKFLGGFAICMASLGCLTFALSQSIQVIDFGQDADEGSGEISYTDAAVTSQKSFYTPSQTHHFSQTASAQSEDASSVAVLDSFVSVKSSFSEPVRISFEAQPIFSTPFLFESMNSVTKHEYTSSSIHADNVNTPVVSSEFLQLSSSLSSSLNSTLHAGARDMFGVSSIYLHSFSVPKSEQQNLATSQRESERVSIASNITNLGTPFTSRAMEIFSSEMNLQTLRLSNNNIDATTSTQFDPLTHEHNLNKVSIQPTRTLVDNERSTSLLFNYEETVLSAVFLSSISENLFTSFEASTSHFASFKPEMHSSDPALVQTPYLTPIEMAFLTDTSIPASHILETLLTSSFVETINASELLSTRHLFPTSSEYHLRQTKLSSSTIQQSLSVVSVQTTSVVFRDETSMELYSQLKENFSLPVSQPLIPGSYSTSLESDSSFIRSSAPGLYSHNASFISLDRSPILTSIEITPSLEAPLPTSQSLEMSTLKLLETVNLQDSVTASQFIMITPTLSFLGHNGSSNFEPLTSNTSMPNVSLSSVDSSLPVDLSDTLHSTEAQKSSNNMLDATFRVNFTAPEEISSIITSSVAHGVAVSLIEIGVSNSMGLDSLDESFSNFPVPVVTTEFSATSSHFVMITPTLSLMDNYVSSSFVSFTSGTSSLSTRVSSASPPLSSLHVIDAVVTNTTGVLHLTSSFVRSTPASLTSGVFTISSSVSPYLPLTSADVNLQLTPILQRSTLTTNYESGTVDTTAKSIIFNKSLEHSSQYDQDVFITTTSFTALNVSPTKAYLVPTIESRTRFYETSGMVSPSVTPTTTVLIPVVAEMTDVTFVFSFTVNELCSTLRQVPYSRRFKKSLTRLLLHVSKLKSKSGIKIRIGEAQCSMTPHLISVSFYEVDVHSLTQAINSTYPFYGDKQKYFSQPIEIRFSVESKSFVVTITGFEKMKVFSQSASKAGIFGMNTAVIAIAACLCVILVCVGSCVFFREMYLKSRSDCLEVSSRLSPRLSVVKIKTKAAQLTHNSGLYEGSKIGIDNPALCSSVYNDLEMTEVHLGDTDEDDNWSYYNPYDGEYSSIGYDLNMEFDGLGATRNVFGNINSAFSLSSIDDDIENYSANSVRTETSKESRKPMSPSNTGNYGLVIGLLGYNKQHEQRMKQEESKQSFSPQGQQPLRGQKKPQNMQRTNGQSVNLEENIYAVPIKYPRKKSKKRPSLRTMVSTQPIMPETSLSMPPQIQRKPSPVPPPRRQKRTARSNQGQRSAQARETVQRTQSRDNMQSTGQVNHSFMGDEGYAAISGSTLSFHF
ncbi:hypothetical protein ElyMa_001056700 [Elysia marginata]|uniref:SEA domain-containing protein n=1 Tax=Elysia marginata TaxID=1093978 RepID=A0AAV4HR48_9GAST|nr:hypothetical protein ElyMa_001056700 [Elysia marginata]